MKVVLAFKIGGRTALKRRVYTQFKCGAGL
jgi:hypothetical protein